MVETYNTWNHHGEQLDNASSSNATKVGNVEPNEQVMDILNDVFSFALTNTNQKGEDDMPTPMDSVEFEQYEKLIKKCQLRVILGVRGLFGSHGHCGTNAMKNKVSYVEPVFRLPFGAFQENATKGQLFVERP